MRTKKMVRHNKRHSRKKGGKRSRGRRQYGGIFGMWKTLINASDNQGINIEYKGFPPKREWLICGGNQTNEKLFEDAKCVNVMRYLQHMLGFIDIRAKGVKLFDFQFNNFLLHLRGMYPGMYANINAKLRENGIVVSSHHVTSIPLPVISENDPLN